jgi:hypothetical protein
VYTEGNRLSSIWKEDLSEREIIGRTEREKRGGGRREKDGDVREKEEEDEEEDKG